MVITSCLKCKVHMKMHQISSSKPVIGAHSWRFDFKVWRITVSSTTAYFGDKRGKIAQFWEGRKDAQPGKY